MSPWWIALIVAIVLIIALIIWIAIPPTWQQEEKPSPLNDPRFGPPHI